MTRPSGVASDLFQALVEYSSDAIALLDERAIIRFASRSTERVLGYGAEERVGRSAFELVHEDDLPKVREALGRTMSEPGVPFTSEFRVRHKDGSWRHIEAVAVNRLTEPAVGGVVVNYRDVTERTRAAEALKTSAERLRHLFETAPDIIYYCNPDGRFTYVNPTASRVMKYTEHELIGRHFLTLIRSDCQTIARDFYLRQLAAKTPNSYLEFPAVTKDKQVVWVGQHVQLVFEHGEVVGVQAICRDISKQKADEEQLRESQKMEAVGRLARGIAHDFNNVLAAILGCADLQRIRLKPDDPSYAEALEIAKASERGAALTRQLLAFSRRQAVEPKVLDVHEVLRGFDTMLQRIAGEITLRLHTPGAAPKVRVEPGQLEQVVMNLVLNARDATPPGGAIDVHAATVDLDAGNASGLPPGRYARIAVHDTGTGIDPSLQSHVFEPFFTTKDPSKGTGLGLSIVYGIAKEAGGTVTFSSPPGEGATFEVLLPLAHE